ncbi:hypothetical protein DY000_02048059, partial [Brassica cretica]
DIGLNGDSGEVEYLLFHTNDPAFRSKASFRSAVNCYIEAVRQLAHEILELTAEGLGVPPHTFSRLISSVDSDSILRVNHYPPSDQFFGGATLSDKSVSLTRTQCGAGLSTDFTVRLLAGLAGYTYNGIGPKRGAGQLGGSHEFSHSVSLVTSTRAQSKQEMMMEILNSSNR